MSTRFACLISLTVVVLASKDKKSTSQPNKHDPNSGKGGGFITMEEFQELRFQMDQVYSGNRFRNRVVSLFQAWDSYSCRGAISNVTSTDGDFLFDFFDPTSTIAGFSPLTAVVRDFWPSYVKQYGCTRSDIMEPIIRAGKTSATFRGNVNQYTNLHTRPGAVPRTGLDGSMGAPRAIRLLHISISALRTAQNTWRLLAMNVTVPTGYAEGAVPYSSLARIDGSPYVEDGFTLLDEYAAQELCPMRERLTETELDHVAVRQLRGLKPSVAAMSEAEHAEYLAQRQREKMNAAAAP